MDNNLSKIQEKAYKILIFFDKFCKDNNLSYFLVYGSLLGAVRHSDFIPWDDDIDVAMPRPDYERLINTLSHLLPKHYELQHFTKTKDYSLNFIKITDKNTTVVEQGGQNTYRIGGVYIDIFPIDGVGNSLKKARKHKKRLSNLKVLIALAANNFYEKKRPLWKKVIIFFAKRLNVKKLQYKFERISQKFSYNDSRYIAIHTGMYGDREIMPKYIFEKTKEIRFRDHYFNSPIDCEIYLKLLYGNYMELPPEEKRISHHNFVYVNLNQSFYNFDPKEI